MLILPEARNGVAGTMAQVLDGVGFVSFFNDVSGMQDISRFIKGGNKIWRVVSACFRYFRLVWCSILI